MAKNLISSPGLKTNTASRQAADSVGAVSGPPANANPSRAELTTQNDHATQVLYLALNTTDGTTVPTAALNAGIRVNAAGGQWTTNSYLGPVAAVATGAATGALVTEI